MNLSNEYNRYKELAEKWLKGTITPEEAKEYNQWYNAKGEELPVTVEPEIAHNEEALKQKIIIKVRRELGLKAKQGKKRVLYTLMSAAAIVLILVSGIYWYQYRTVNDKIYPVAKIKDPSFKNDVAPGSNKAILVLADGRKIALDSATNGVLATQGATKIIRKADGNIVYENGKNAGESTMMDNTMSTPIGAQYQLVLSDGTKVWLNAGSSITYPTDFMDTVRKVNITGEVYFEVTKNPQRPFIVSTGNMNVRVLGTHFNVNAYSDERTINTTLLEGKVEVINKVNGHITAITPGQQAQYDNFGVMKVEEVNTDNIVAWKNGMFEFNRTDIVSLMKQVARWYNINVTYEGPITKDLFTGTVPRNVSLTELLTVLKYAKVHFKLDKNNLTVLS